MGDSFISGEGGRWAGNGLGSSSDSYFGTDHGIGTYSVDGRDTSYETSPDAACDRSDSAEITHVRLPNYNGLTKINLACSGAVTDDILNRSFKNEPPQLDQLRGKAATYDIKAIVVSIGGNDIKFSDIIESCVKHYLSPTVFGSCESTNGAGFNTDVNARYGKVVQVLQGVRRVMAEAGQGASYRLILQSYPTPIPAAADYRTPEGGVADFRRNKLDGCPFMDSDSNWAVGTIIPGISNVLSAAADDANAIFLDLSKAFAGHELCHRESQLSTGAEGVPIEKAEWVRWIPYLALAWASQGNKQEAIHPNRYGQQVLGTCLNRLLEVLALGGPAVTWDYTCTGQANKGLDGIALNQIPGSDVGRLRALNGPLVLYSRPVRDEQMALVTAPAVLADKQRVTGGAHLSSYADYDRHPRQYVFAPSPWAAPAQSWSLSPGGTIPGGVRIEERNGFVLGVDPASKEVRLETKSDSVGQVWFFYSAGPGKSMIVNGDDSSARYCLTAPSAMGGVLKIAPCVGDAPQRWTARSLYRWYSQDQLLSQIGGCLGPMANHAVGGARVDASNCSGDSTENWVPAPAPGSAEASLSETADTTAIAPAAGAGGSGPAALSATAFQAADMPAPLEPARTLGPPMVLRSQNLCLDTDGAATANHTQTVVAECNGSPTQVWQSDEKARLVQTASGRCLANPAAPDAQDIPLTIEDCAEDARQAWVPEDLLPSCDDVLNQDVPPTEPNPSELPTPPLIWPWPFVFPPDIIIPAHRCTVAPRPSGPSIDAAYSFLRTTQYTYSHPGELGVPRSYTGGFFAQPQFGPGGFQASFTYDNSLVIAGLLARHGSWETAQAIDLGDSLLYAQAHDRVPDGRLRASYEPDPFVTINGSPYVGGFSVYTGNMAWAGMAFSRLYAATGQQRYLDGAMKAANWIQTNAADSRGAGGYTGGERNTDETGAQMIRITWKATEHNIDVGAFFAMLADLTGNQVWKQRSENAFAFVRTMQADDGRLWTGTGLDGVTQNRDTVPLDIQVWSFLATLDPRYSASIDWGATNLAATDGPFQGVSFGRTDTSKVWFEGTAHLLAAYRARNAPGDNAKATALLTTLQLAQTSAPNANGKAIVAASSDGLNTGEGDIYYASPHTGATAWYLLASLSTNPFRL